MTTVVVALAGVGMTTVVVALAGVGMTTVVIAPAGVGMTTVVIALAGVGMTTVVVALAGVGMTRSKGCCVPQPRYSIPHLISPLRPERFPALKLSLPLPIFQLLTLRLDAEAGSSQLDPFLERHKNK